VLLKIKIKTLKANPKKFGMIFLKISISLKSLKDDFNKM
jgi:hypothetical protein